MGNMNRTSEARRAENEIILRDARHWDRVRSINTHFLSSYSNEMPFEYSENVVTAQKTDKPGRSSIEDEFRMFAQRVAQ
jgi:hypothetical protein